MRARSSLPIAICLALLSAGSVSAADTAPLPLLPPLCRGKRCVSVDPERVRLLPNETTAVPPHLDARDPYLFRLQNRFGADPEADEALASQLGARVEAVRRAPGDPHRRYELGCLLLRLERPDDALAVLRTLDVPGCTECANALARLEGGDPSCGPSLPPTVRALATTAPRTPVFEAATRFFQALRTGEVHGFEPYLPARAGVVVDIFQSNADPPDLHVYLTIRGRADFAKWIAEARDDRPYHQFVVGEGLACEGRCCTTVVPGLTHHTMYLDGMCFDSERNPRLTKLLLTAG